MAERKAMIDGHHALPISRQAQLVGMSRGSVYYVPQAVGAADLALMRRMDALHLEHPFMGARACCATSSIGRGSRSGGST
jgi:putative transposase